MALKIRQKNLSRLSLVGIVLLVILTSVQANPYDIICPDSENPFNFPFTVPTERLDYYVYADLGPVALNYIDPRDVACRKNFDDVTVEQFQKGVRCLLRGPSIVVCDLQPKCKAERKEIFSRLREATMRALDDAVLKIDGIKLLNMFINERFLFFGKERIGDLTGLEVMKRLALGEVNILNGVSLSNNYRNIRIGHSLAYDFLGKAASFYFRLKEAAEPTGSLARGITCTIDNVSADVRSCYAHLLDSLRSRSELHDSDSKLLSLLDESLDFVISRLSDDRRRFSGVKIPFTGHCVGSKGVDPSSPYSNLLKLVETLWIQDKVI